MDIKIGKILITSVCPLILLAGCFSSRPAVNKPKITIWHWMTDRDSVFQDLARRYERLSGVKIDFELFAPSDSYSQKVRAAAQGRNLPDIFGVLSEKKDFASFIKAGYVLDLTPYMDENNSAWRNEFFTRALAVDEFKEGNSYGVKPGVYGVPIDMVAIMMLYNKTLLKRLGLDPERPPQTFTEFLALGKKIKAANLQGLVSGWVELWLVNCFASNYAFNIMGRDKVLATLRGEVPYTDPDWIKVFALFKRMKEAGIISNRVVSMINKTAEQIFASGKAVFAFNGSWCVNVYKGMNPNLDYGAILPPKASDKFPMAVWGGAGSSFVVNAHSKNKEEAVKFLKWLTEPAQQAYLARATNNLPANKQCRYKMPKILKGFSKAVDYSTHPNTWGISEFPIVNEALGRGIQSIILGEKTPEQAALEVQKIKEREMAKRRKR